ncbi:hypothetical protein BJ742DRAFT_825354 [Cladochytrium replicatum]|nr:hypothetical protein BJ742DRAFT_825354 [Cladochytrium replicatum]
MSRVRSFLDSDVIDLDEDYNESSQGVNDKDLDPDLQRALKISSVATDAMDTPDDPIIVKVKRKPVETRDKIVCKLLPTSNFLPLLKTSCQKWELDIESVVLVYRNVPIRPLVTIKSMKLSRAVTLELWNKDDWDEAIHHQTVERTKLLTATAGASEKGQEQSEKIRLQIKSPDEQRYTVTMNIESTVVQLIQRYSKARSLQLRPEKIKMKLDGEVLPPTSKIADHELEDNDIIDCVW